METFFKINLAIHIAAGFTGFFMAPVAMIAKKGDKAHLQWGLGYGHCCAYGTVGLRV